MVPSLLLIVFTSRFKYTLREHVLEESLCLRADIEILEVVRSADAVVVVEMEAHPQGKSLLLRPRKRRLGAMGRTLQPEVQGSLAICVFAFLSRLGPFLLKDIQTALSESSKKRC